MPQVATTVLIITGYAIAIARVATASKPFWAKFPVWLQHSLPAALVALGALPPALAGVKSWNDLIVAVVLSLGAGFAAWQGDSGPKDPPGGEKPVGAVERISFAKPEHARVNNEIPDEPAEFRGWRHPAWRLALCCFLMVGCGTHVNWPKVLECATPLEQPLIGIVASVLTGTGDVESELAGVATQYGPGLVECAVQQLVSDLAAGPTTARASRAAARGRAFLEKVQQ